MAVPRLDTLLSDFDGEAGGGYEGLTIVTGASPTSSWPTMRTSRKVEQKETRRRPEASPRTKRLAVISKQIVKWTNSEGRDKPVKSLIDEKRLIEYGYRPVMRKAAMWDNGTSKALSNSFLSFSTRLFSTYHDESEEASAAYRPKADNLPSPLQRKGIRRALSPLPSNVSQPTIIMTSNHTGTSSNSPRHAANQTKSQANKSSSGDLNKRVEKQLSMSEKHVRKLPAVTLQSPSKPVGSVVDYGRSPCYYKQKSLPARGENSSETMENGAVTILPGQTAPPKPAKADFRNNQVLFARYRAQRRKEYYVHPEWLSESITVQRLNLTDRDEKSHWLWKGLLNSAAGSTETYPPPGRRSRSVPPPENGINPPLSPVNPITWR